MRKYKEILDICALLVLASFGMWSYFSFGSIISNMFSKPGSAIDFHSYWYSGHFLRQGKDPYQAYFANQEPTASTYLDGNVSTIPIAQPGLEIIPANTAPLVILLTLFSFVSWSTAKISWMMFNLIFMITIPWMTIRLWPEQITVKVDRRNLFLAFSFWSLLATRSASGNGQTTLLVLTLMLLTLLEVNKNWVLAGLALGVALSKYSLSLPLLLFLLFKQENRVVAISLATQAVGIIVLSLLTSTSPLQVLNEYFLMLKKHVAFPGINLVSLMPDVGSLASIILTLVVWGFTGYWILAYYRKLSVSDKQFGDLHILNILILWTLLVVYHREYDAVVFILFIKLLIYGLGSNRWCVSEQTKIGLMLLLVLSVLWMSRPGTILSFLPALWTPAAEAVATIILTLSLGLTIGLLYRISSTSILKAGTN